jgi:hypothetical protein
MPCAYACPPDTTCAPSTTPLACNGNQRCDRMRPWDSCYAPCAGKTCGEPCHLCPRDETGFGCGETTELKKCDANGICGSSTRDLGCP